MRWKVLWAPRSKRQLTVTIAAGHPITFGTLTTPTALVRADHHLILPAKRRIATLAFGFHLKCHSTLFSAMLKRTSEGHHCCVFLCAEFPNNVVLALPNVIRVSLVDQRQAGYCH
tara:strand:- start:543 stop:887 length:345 start_codon:yes stop_codon:yes gene_type:complete